MLLSGKSGFRNLDQIVLCLNAIIFFIQAMMNSAGESNENRNNLILTLEA